MNRIAKSGKKGALFGVGRWIHSGSKADYEELINENNIRLEERRLAALNKK